MHPIGLSDLLGPLVDPAFVEFFTEAQRRCQSLYTYIMDKAPRWSTV